MYGYIYETINLVNGKKYIGKHKSSKFDEKYYGSGKAFLKALNKYGKENFKVKIIEEINTNQEDLDLKEMYWIKYFNAVKDKQYYNNSSGGKEEGWIGYHSAIKENGGFSTETLLKMKEANKDRVWIKKDGINKHIKKEYLEEYLEEGWLLGRILSMKGEKHPMFGKHPSKETLEKLKESHKGQIPWNKGKHNIYSEEALKKMKHTNKGYIPSEETKRKQSEALKGEKAYWYGKHLSEETKKKISAANKGRKHSEEAKKKMRETQKQRGNAFKGKHHTEETKKRLSDFNIGKKRINDGYKNKTVSKEELNYYLNSGWKLGMIKNIKR